MASVHVPVLMTLRSVACVCFAISFGVGTALFEKQSDATSFSSGQNYAQEPMEPNICTSPGWFIASIEQLRLQVESVELRVLASFTKIVVGGQQEASVISELLTVFQHAQAQIAVCEVQRQESVRDVELYRRELLELEAIARADHDVYNWSAIALLGERSLTIRSGSSAHAASESDVHSDMHRAAEMHFTAARAAKQVATCERRRALSGDASLVGQSPEAGVEDPCRASREVLLQIFQLAHSHISSLLQVAISISVDDVCWFTAFEMYNETRTPLERRVQDARLQICDGVRDGEAVQVEAQIMQTTMAATYGSLIVSCLDVTWQSYAASVGSLVAMAIGRPVIPDTFCSNATQPTAPWQMSLLSEGSFPNSRVVELEREMTLTRHLH